jgi:nucleoside-diphosphate-sugar epimerase
MNVFVTGATGFIGSAVVEELLRSGHRVTGLARSDRGASQLRAAGAQIHRGTLEDLASLKAGAAAADGVIHLAFIHTFPGFLLAPGKDAKAIDALGSVLAGTGKPLVVAGGVHGLRTGHILTEEYIPDYRKVPRKSEQAVLAWADRGVRASVIRLPPSVHGQGDKGFVAWIVARARKNGAAVFAGDGRQRWAAIHRLDAARLFRLALEKGLAGAIYNGVADEGVPFGDLAAAIGRGIGVPSVSRSSWGAVRSLGLLLGLLARMDCPASSSLTQQALNWSANQPGLLDDFELGNYFAVTPGIT